MKKLFFYTVILCSTQTIFAQNEGLHFDGTDDFVNVGDHPHFDMTTQITIEAWIKLDQIKSGWPTIIKRGGTDSHWRLQMHTAGDRIEFSPDGSVGNFTAPSYIFGPADIGVWRHIAGTYDGSTIAIYIDGILIDSDARSGSFSSGAGNSVTIGGRGTGDRNFPGAIDELRVWDVGRTQSEIQSTMNSTLVGNEPGLVAYYDFEEGVGEADNSIITEIVDNGSNATNGTLDGFARTGTTSNWVTADLPWPFYSQNSGAFDVITSWNTARDGSGVDAVVGDFTSGLRDFIIQSGGAISSSSIDITISDLAIESGGSLNPGDANLTINGTTNVSGIFQDATAIGTNTFIGLLTVNSGGNFISDDGLHEYRGGITNDGNFNPIGATEHDFTTNAQTVTSSTDLFMDGQVDFHADVLFAETNAEVRLSFGATMQIHIGFTVTNQITTGFLSQRGGSFQIDGNLINDVDAYFKIWSGSPEGGLVATASGNTIEYFRSGGQTILDVDYHHLIIGSSGLANQSKDFDGALYNITGDLELTDTNLTANFSTINLSGNLSGSGTSSVSLGGIAHLVMQGSSQQIINTPGFTTFELRDLTLNNAAGVVIQTPMYANSGQLIVTQAATLETTFEVDGNITLTENLTIDGGLLIKPLDATFQGGPFTNSNMLVMSNGGLVRTTSPTSGDDVTYPMGTGSEYTPITITPTHTSGASPYIEAGVTALEEPNALVSGSSLTKYWTVNSNGLTISAATIAMTYDDMELVGTEASYVPAYFGASWLSGTTAEVTEAINLATFSLGAATSLNGNYTAGETNAFNPPILTSITPSQNAIDIVASANIVFTFSENMSQSSIDGGSNTFPDDVLDDNIQIRSTSNGNISGIWSGGGTSTLNFNPTNDFDAGEVVHITVTSAAQSSAGVSLNQPSTVTFITQTTTGPATPNFFTEQVVSTLAVNALDVHVGDVDGDGDLDILSASASDDKIAWYENDGAADPSFTERVVSTVASEAFSVNVGDVDGDGDLDILSASASDDKIAWYENDGAADPTFTEQVAVSTAANGARSVHVGDVDGDGDLDVLSASINDDKIAWYENDGAADPTFTERVVSTVANGAFNVHVGDVDGDGDLDILSASIGDDKIAWYENNGAANPTFTERVVSSGAGSAFTSSIHVGDVDGDGDLDILSASGLDNKIAWYENDGAVDPTFTEQVAVSTAANGARSVHVGDVDGDGDLDILSASQLDDKIAWYENDGTADPSFTERVVSTVANGAISVHVGDVDGDGDLDILSASSLDNKIAWYENTFSAPATQATNITFSNLGTTQMDVSWANGDGSNRLVVVHAGAAVDADPVDASSYTANASFGSGTQIGTENYVVHNGTGSSVTVTGLTLGETYHVRVYEYNGTAGDENYNLNTPTGNPANQLFLAIATFTIDAIADANVNENSAYTSVTPSLSGATPIGAITYTLGGADAADFTIAPTTGVVSMVVRDFENPEDNTPDNVYEVTITATDSHGNIDTEDWMVTVDDVMESATFTIDAIADANVNENAAYTSATPTLSGATPIGTLTYSLAGADAGDFTIAPTTGIVSMVARDFENPVDATPDNVYELTITATDSDGNNDTEAWTITVDDLAETATFTIDAIADANVNENTSYTSVTPILSGATPIGTLTYTLGGTDAADFAINASTGVVNMVVRDFESPEDANTDNVYEITITATDSDSNSDTEAWTVTVDDVTEVVAFTIDVIADANVDENVVYTSVTTALSGTTPVGTLTYTLGGTDAADFTINASTGVVSMVVRDFESPEDANTDNVYELTITATDSDGNSDTEAWTVTVDDVTEAAVFTIDPIATANVEENNVYTSVTPSLSGATPIGTLIYTLGGADAGDFTINASTGVVSMVARDFENPEDDTSDNVYEITITATDSDGNNDTEDWTVTVDDVIEVIISPEITLYQGTDNTGTAITDAQVGATDFGTGIESNDITQTFAIENTGTSVLNITNISSSAMEYTLAGVPVTVAPGATEVFTVTLSGAEIGVFSATITIESDDVDESSFTFPITGEIILGNQAPVFSYAFYLDENSPTGKLIGTIDGTDPEGDPLEYLLVAGNTNGAFSVGILSGDLSVASQKALDYETTPVFDLLVQADDGNGGTSMVTITINLNDLDESQVLGVSDLEVQVKTYPNPATEVVFLQVSEGMSREVDVTMFTLSGKSVLTPQEIVASDLIKLGLGDVIPGVYLLKITYEGKLLTKPILVK